MIRRPSHLSVGLTDLAAGLLTAGGLLWSLAMTGAGSSAIGGMICGLHRETVPGVHCGWCGLALALALSGGALLVIEAWRELVPVRPRTGRSPR